MITTPTLWRLAVHYGFWIWTTGGVSKRKRTQPTPMSPMWHITYFKWYYMGSEGRPFFRSRRCDRLEAVNNHRRDPSQIRGGKAVSLPIHGLLAGDNPGLDMTKTNNNLEIKREADQTKLHRMAKVPDYLEMWQGSQNLRATQKQSHAHNKQMMAIRYVSDTEEIVKVSWSNYPHARAAAFTLSVWSPVPPALSAKDLTGGQTQRLNARGIKWIDCHTAESDEDSAHENISDTENYLGWNVDLDNPIDSEDEREADNESDIQSHSCIEDSETPERWNVRAALNIPGLIQPTWK